MSEQVGMPEVLKSAIESGLLEKAESAFKNSAEDTFENRMEQAGNRLVTELHCLLMDCKDNAVLSKWFDSAHAAIDNWGECCNRGKIGF